MKERQTPVYFLQTICCRITPVQTSLRAIRLCECLSRCDKCLLKIKIIIIASHKMVQVVCIILHCFPDKQYGYSQQRISATKLCNESVRVLC